MASSIELDVPSASIVSVTYPHPTTSPHSAHASDSACAVTLPPLVFSAQSCASLLREAIANGETIKPQYITGDEGETETIDSDEILTREDSKWVNIPAIQCDNCARSSFPVFISRACFHWQHWSYHRLERILYIYSMCGILFACLNIFQFIFHFEQAPLWFSLMCLSLGFVGIFTVAMTIYSQKYRWQHGIRVAFALLCIRLPFYCLQITYFTFEKDWVNLAVPSIMLGFRLPLVWIHYTVCWRMTMIVNGVDMGIKRRKSITQEEVRQFEVFKWMQRRKKTNMLTSRAKEITYPTEISITSSTDNDNIHIDDERDDHISIVQHKSSSPSSNETISIIHNDYSKLTSYGGFND